MLIGHKPYTGARHGHGSDFTSTKRAEMPEDRAAVRRLSGDTSGGFAGQVAGPTAISRPARCSRRSRPLKNSSVRARRRRLSPNPAAAVVPDGPPAGSRRACEDARTVLLIDHANCEKKKAASTALAADVRLRGGPRTDRQNVRVSLGRETAVTTKQVARSSSGAWA